MDIICLVTYDAVHGFFFFNQMSSFLELVAFSSWTVPWVWKVKAGWFLAVFRFPALLQQHTCTSSTALGSSFSAFGGVEKQALAALTEAALLLSGNNEIACFLLNNGAGFSSYTLMDHADFSTQLLRQRHLQDKDEPADGTLLQVRLISDEQCHGFILQKL